MEADIPDSYIRVAEQSQDTTRHCFNIKSDCINIDAHGLINKAMPDEETFQYVSQLSPGIAKFEKDIMPQVYQTYVRMSTHTMMTCHMYTVHLVNLTV